MTIDILYKLFQIWITEAFYDFQYRSDKTRLFANFGILIKEEV